MVEVKRRTQAPRTVFFDIESTDLKAPFGNILCCSFVTLDGKKPFTYRLDSKEYRKAEQENDSALVMAIKLYLEDSFCWVGWNSKMFDVAMLNARLTLAGIRPIEKRMHIDLMYYARRPNVAFYSSRLDAVAKTLELPVQKTDLDPGIWVKARRLDRGAMDYVVKHCEHDVLVLREVFSTVSPFIRNIHV